MKLLLTATIIVVQISYQSYGQSNFNLFVKDFPILELPIESIEKNHSDDTLHIDLANKVLVTDQEVPYYIKDNKRVEVDDYYGQIMKGHSSYKMAGSGKLVNFSTKAYPIGRVDLSNNYITLIVKVVALESTFYDIYNFTKGGELKSFLPLYLGYRDVPHEEVSFLMIESDVSKEGAIQWHENIDGRKTKRTYVLNDEGYFEITSEAISGESEF